MPAPTPLDRPTAAVFRALSRARGRRIFHPSGAVFDAALAVGAGLPGTALFRPGARHAAVVRLSRGLGLPEPLPDFLGLAVRVPDAYGAGRHQDLLLVTSGSAPLVRHALVPASRYAGHVLTSVLPYDVGGRRLLFAAVPAGGVAAGVPGAFRIAVAGRAGGWDDVAELALGPRRSETVDEDLRFDPWHTGGGLRPAGFLNRLRAAAYPASQQGRAGGAA